MANFWIAIALFDFTFVLLSFAFGGSSYKSVI